jgi:hypothetical protein
VIYALFRLIFDVIVPIVRVSGQMKKKMREFQDNIPQPNRQNHQQEEPLKKQSDTKQKTGDYIDFEEVKS